MDNSNGKKVNWGNYVGKRCLVAEAAYTDVIIEDVSPSGNYIKLRFGNNSVWDKADGWLLIEVFASGIDRATPPATPSDELPLLD